MYFYVIEAYLGDESLLTPPVLQSEDKMPIESPSQTSRGLPHRFFTLADWINGEENRNLPTNKKILDKIKILLDCLHQRGQPYFGLST